MFGLLFVGALAKSKWPMSFEQCAVTINDMRWDFSSLKNKVYTYWDQYYTGHYFYIKLCDQLFEADLPSYYNKTGLGTNAVRCTQPGDYCVQMSSIYEFEWTPKTDDNLSMGVIWESEGTLRHLGLDQWEVWEMEYEFLCDPTSSQEQPDFYVDASSDEPRLVVKWENKMACGEKVSETPTPTPGPWAPDTRVLFRDEGNPDIGIQMDVRSVSNGRFGSHWPVLYGDYDVRYLFLNPSDRIMGCPSNVEGACDAEYSSAWVCQTNNASIDQVLTTCESFGFLNEHSIYDLINDHDIYDGFYYKLNATESGKMTEIRFLCNDVSPAGHMYMDVGATTFLGHNDYLQAIMYTVEACPRAVATPAPVVDHCKFEETNGGWKVDIDLMTYTHKDVPHTADVIRLTGEGYEEPFKLFYLPCDGMTCPSGYDCGGDEDAFVWLCDRKDPMPGFTPFCTAYGLHEHNMSAASRGGYLFDGVDFNMHADHGRGARAHWKCDESLTSDALSIDYKVALSGKTLQFEVKAHQACPTGSGPTPTPVPHLSPEQPVKGYTPTPTPLPSPYPYHALFDNYEYIYLDFQALQEPEVLRVDQTLLIRGRNTTTHTVWSMWDPIGCPDGWKCGDFYRANLWQCWYNSSWDQICHPVADKYVPGTSVHLLKEGDLHGGISIIYEGQYGVNMEIIVTCDPNHNYTSWLPIAHSPVVYQMNMMGGAEWTFSTTSSIACPKEFATVTIPTTARSNPPSTATQVSSYTTEMSGGKVELDLSLIEDTMVSTMIVGYQGSSLHKAEVHYSPTKLIGCPTGKSCGVYANDQANIWECVNSLYGQCFPVGDQRYGLDMDMALVGADSHASIRASYEGGVSITPRAHVTYICNSSIPYGEFSLDSYGTEVGTAGLSLYVHTSTVCAGMTASTQGGAIFLLILSSLAVGYFGIGTIVVYAVTGIIAIPFESFWSAVLGYALYTITFIFTLGRNPYNGAVSYDQI